MKVVFLLLVFISSNALAFKPVVESTRQDIQRQVQQQEVLTRKQQLEFNLQFLEDGIFRLEETQKKRRLTLEEQMSLSKLRELREEATRKLQVLSREVETIRNMRELEQRKALQEMELLRRK